ncbi:MAG: YraN family protein [Pseudomonadota bacterium]
MNMMTAQIEPRIPPTVPGWGRQTGLPPAAPPDGRRRRSGRRHYGGLAAEAAIARHYEARGAEVLAQRWRAGMQGAGEIDLIVTWPGLLVFVEVKARKFLGADSPISEKQWQRLGLAAESYRMLHAERTGAIPDCRFDAALVGPDGCLEIIENARLG